MSTRKGLLKNVQDGISIPLGGREIQETKAGTVLPDTIKLQHCRYYQQDSCENGMKASHFQEI